MFAEKKSPISFATFGIRAWAEMWAYVLLREYVALLVNLQKEVHREHRIREAVLDNDQLDTHLLYFTIRLL